MEEWGRPGPFEGCKIVWWKLCDYPLRLRSEPSTLPKAAPFIVLQKSWRTGENWIFVGLTFTSKYWQVFIPRTCWTFSDNHSGKIYIRTHQDMFQASCRQGRPRSTIKQLSFNLHQYNYYLQNPHDPTNTKIHSISILYWIWRIFCSLRQSWRADAEDYIQLTQKLCSVSTYSLLFRVLANTTDGSHTYPAKPVIAENQGFPKPS